MATTRQRFMRAGIVQIDAIALHQSVIRKIENQPHIFAGSVRGLAAHRIE